MRNVKYVPVQAADLPAAGRPVENWRPGPWSVPQPLAGSVSISPQGEFEAGSWQSFELVYVAGKFGMDDSGSLKLCFKFATDQTALQTSDPSGPGFVSAEASNGAVLQIRFDPKQNVRPWDKTLHIRVARGFLREGDRLTIRLGDRRQGSPGLRMQTFAEPYFEFHTLVDPVACYHFVPVRAQPYISIVAGPRKSWAAVLPSTVNRNERFSLRIRSDDIWGNPSGRGTARLRLSTPHEVSGLPAEVELRDGDAVLEIDGLTSARDGVLSVAVHDEAGDLLCLTNPALIADHGGRALFWADFHAQSGETIGTGSAHSYFTYARDMAFLDIVGHQGNDFQITQEIWQSLNHLFDEYEVPGRFVVIPGYEWSGNTALGGDRNVFFPDAGRKIRRSSHALVPDHSDIESDCHTATDLFDALKADGGDAITFAHVGGRYADISVAHDPAIETAVEVHSSWGTFEWIVNDAFDLGYRVGIVANSDGHKGRPGAESPGASMFGACGGLTCVQMAALSREETFKALRARRHFATTGSRMLLDVQTSFPQGAIEFSRDPVLGASPIRRVEEAVMMGAIVHTSGNTAQMAVTLHASSPVERIEIRNGREIVSVLRPYALEEPGRRIRVVWSGAEYRGRFRMTAWDGHALLECNAFHCATGINFFNSDQPLERQGEHGLSWKSVTTGNFSGFDAMLQSARGGRLRVATAQGEIDLEVDSIGIEPQVFEFGGLARRIEVYRLPDRNPHTSFAVQAEVELDALRDNPLYVSAVTEDGHQCWSSPVYAIPKPDWL